MAHLRAAGREPLEVDQVHVGAISRREHAPIEQTDRACGLRGLPAHEEREIEPAARVVATPERQQGRGEARITDRADVRSAVAEPDDRVVVSEHLSRGVEVPVVVVEAREIEERVAAVAEQVVVRVLERIATFARGDAGDARLGFGLVVGRIAEHEHPVEGVQQPRPELAARGALRVCGRHPRLERGVREDRDPLGERKRRDRPVDRVREHGMQRALEPEQQPDRARRDLRGDRETVAVRGVEQLKQLPPAVASCL